MLCIRVEFVHGVVRAGSPDDIAMTGLDDPGEWPPSPARLFSALVAAAGTGSRCEVGDGGELELLEAAEPPEIVANQDEDVLRSPVLPRFVVEDARHEGAVHEYVGRTASMVRPGTRLSPRTPEVTYVWPDVSASPAQLESIVMRAARVSYLGCSDSPVRMTVTTETPPVTAEPAWVPQESGGRAIPVPYGGYTQALDLAFDQWLQGPMRRAWIPTRRASYAPPGEGPPTVVARPTVFWFRISPAVSGRFALVLAETLRDAVLDLYERHVGPETPALLHGHGFQGSGRNHAEFLALPDVGFPHSSGRVHGLAVWLPPETPNDTAANVRGALEHLSVLARPGRFETAVRAYGGEERPRAASPTRWAGPSSRWISALPVVHERWSSHGPDREEVERWFRHAGFECRVLAHRNSIAPLLPGSGRLRPEQVHHKDRSRHPYSFFEVRLDREIDGPVVIGRGRQFGVGLMAPRD